ncbi:brassinosteroid-6-oxidase 2 [Perilla frutescens var. hirtella]|uniref:Brassinosteroid-6-oxidase 2 n=1 Tax=Perilla frutescens var. hirtella TaxID=608512 RepID=A0AAD4PAD4_PERFH|nr:brassinosteroid-6-oxidase 2 [Perilla frutescens var. hirtella]
MELLIMAASLLFLGLFFFLFLSKWNEIILKREGLPPGTMGWPFFGETNEFLKLGPDFMKRQRARYGTVFKSHILGSPTIVSMDPELNRYILLNEAKGLVPGYPKSMLDILGTRNIAAVYGSKHKFLRSNLLSLIGAPLIKDRLLPRIDTYIRLHLSNWEDHMVIDVQQKSTDMALLIGFTQIAEAEFSSIYYKFKCEFDKLLKGSLSLPINLPGTSYYRGFKGRKNAVRILRELIEKRRASPATYDDMLEHLLRDDVETKYALNDEEIIDQIITILYSGYETVSTTSLMAVKYLHDNQEAMQELRHEHFGIRRRKAAEQPLDWDDYKSMRFTRAVVLETLRLATVINGLLRKTTEDMKLNGFFIPKGWKIYVYTREINYDPILYPEPLKFNPWRWLDKNLESHNYCFLFGGGGRMCPGKELGIATVSTFLHYFVTTYRWEEIGGEKIEAFPRVEAPNGYHIKLLKL